MQPHLVLLVLAAALALVYALFWHWQTPGNSGKLKQTEVADYLAIMEATMPLPDDEKRLFLARMRAWGEADDGRPVHMLNIMRYHEQLAPVPGAAAITGAPQQANAHYEKQVLRLVRRLGAYPLIGGDVVGVTEGGQRHSNILGFGPRLDDWGRVIVVRYPNRRAYFKLFSDPEYVEILPFKMAALEVGLAPIAPEVMLPDLRLALAGLFLMAFLATGWWLAAHHG